MPETYHWEHKQNSGYWDMEAAPFTSIKAALAMNNKCPCDCGAEHRLVKVVDGQIRAIFNEEGLLIGKITPDCKDCKGTGFNASGQILEHAVWALVSFTTRLATCFKDAATESKTEPESFNCWMAMAAVIRAAGLPENWAFCKSCNGSGQIQ